MADRARRRMAAAMVAGSCVLLSAGCGFRPLYGESGGGNPATLASVRVELIADRSGQKMRNLLLERLNPRESAGRPLYQLLVTLTESKQELAIRKDESATRANLTVSARFSLAAIDYPELGSLSGAVTSTNSYNVLASEFATQIAENDARDRALAVLAEEIRLRVAAGLRNPRLFIAPEPEQLIAPGQEQPG